jgi:hypothetical protein
VARSSRKSPSTSKSASERLRARKSPSTSKSASERVRALPWAGIAQAGLVVGKRVTDLSAKDRARLARLLRESRGLPGKLAPKDRAELRKLVGKLDPKAISQELLPLMRSGRRRKRG